MPSNDVDTCGLIFGLRHCGHNNVEGLQCAPYLVVPTMLHVCTYLVHELVVLPTLASSYINRGGTVGVQYGWGTIGVGNKPGVD